MSCSKSILELGLLVLNPLVTYKSNVLAEGFGSLPLENNIFKSSQSLRRKPYGPECMVGEQFCSSQPHSQMEEEGKPYKWKTFSESMSGITET